MKDLKNKQKNGIIWSGIIAMMLIMVIGINIVIAESDQQSQQTEIGKPIVIGPVEPVGLNKDLRTLPVAKQWKEGDPIIAGPGQEEISNPTIPVQEPAISPEQKISGPLAPVSSQISLPIINIDGINFTGKYPPDTTGDVGPNYYIQAANSRFAIFDKTGNVMVGASGGNVVGVDISQLWIQAGQAADTCAGNAQNSNTFDPIIQYDHLADRWLITQFVPNTNFCIAISNTSDPVSGGWTLYDFPSNGIINDYPKYGVWPDAYYVGTNDNSGGGNAWAFDRPNMLLLRPATLVGIPINFSVGGPFMLPSDLDGAAPSAGTPNIFVRFVDGSPDRLELRAFHVDWANPAASTFTALPSQNTNSFNSAFCGDNHFRTACISEPGTTQLLDVIRFVPMYRLQYRNFGDHESMVFTHDINVGNNQSANRWYELRNNSGTWQIYQQGTNNPDTTNRWMGSAAMDKFGNMAIGYSISDSILFPGIRYSGRLSSDPLGSLSQGEHSIIEGNGSQLPCGNDCANRWGDYSTLAVDPVDQCTFWYTNEYYKGNSSQMQWQTRIGTFRFCSDISGTKFHDINGNGIKDPGEPGLPNWTITLTDTNGNTITNKTDANGNYSFENLTSTRYVIGEVLQTGYIQTAPGISENGSATYTIDITSGSHFDNKNFGNFKLGQVNGTKFEDLNANGIRDENESVLSGWNITITGTDTLTGSIINLTKTTDINGSYQFTNLTPGTYIISENLKPGFIQTAPSTIIYTINITTSGTSITNQDFGNFHKGKITGGGTIPILGDPKATFGINGQYLDKSNIPNGNIEYQDHIANLNIKSISIKSVASTLDKKKGVITGLAKVNDTGSYPFEVYVEDNGEPGKGVDVFNISIPTYQYTNGAILNGGNIQIHE